MQRLATALSNLSANSDGLCKAPPPDLLSRHRLSQAGLRAVFDGKRLLQQALNPLTQQRFCPPILGRPCRPVPSAALPLQHDFRFGGKETPVYEAPSYCQKTPVTESVHPAFPLLNASSMVHSLTSLLQLPFGFTSLLYFLSLSFTSLLILTSQHFPSLLFTSLHFTSLRRKLNKTILADNSL